MTIHNYTEAHADIKQIVRYLVGSPAYKQPRIDHIHDLIGRVSHNELLQVLGDLNILGLLCAESVEQMPDTLAAALTAHMHLQSTIRDSLWSELAGIDIGLLTKDDTVGPLLLGGLAYGEQLYGQQHLRASDDLVLISGSKTLARALSEQLPELGFHRRSIRQTDPTIPDTIYFTKDIELAVDGRAVQDIGTLNRCLPSPVKSTSSSIPETSKIGLVLRDDLFDYRGRHSQEVDMDCRCGLPKLPGFQTLTLPSLVPYLAAQLVLHVATEPIKAVTLAADFIRSLELLNENDVEQAIRLATSWGTATFFRKALEGVSDYVPSIQLGGLSPVGMDFVSTIADKAMGYESPRYGGLSAINRVAPGKLLYHEALIEHNRLTSYLAEVSPDLRLIPVGNFGRCDKVTNGLEYITEERVFAHAVKPISQYDRTTKLLERDTRTISAKLQSGCTLQIHSADKKSLGLEAIVRSSNRDEFELLQRRAKDCGLELNKDSLTRQGETLALNSPEEVLGWLQLTGKDGSYDRVNAGCSTGYLTTLFSAVTAPDLKGTFHVHTPYSDGRSSIQDLIEKVREMGMEYIGISDHNYGTGIRQHFLRENQVEAQFEEIAGIQARFPDIRILRGIECDIDDDGRLAMSDKTLAMFDFVIAAIHYIGNPNGMSPLDRILTAIKNPHVNIIAHPSGRTLLADDRFSFEGISAAGYAVDWEKLIGSCVKYNVLLECNVAPHRIDVEPEIAAQLLSSGMPLVLSADAHSSSQLTYLRSGLDVIKKSLNGPEDLINCWSAQRVLSFFQNQRTNSPSSPQ